MFLTIVSDNVWISLISLFGTLISSLLAFILAMQNGNRTRLDNINTQMNGKADKAQADLVAAHATIKFLQDKVITNGDDQK